MRNTFLILLFVLFYTNSFAQSDTIKWEKYWYIKTHIPNHNKDLYEYQDTLGNIMIPKGKYERLRKPDEFGYINAWKKVRFGKLIEENVGFINIHDSILIPFNYSRAFSFSQNLACVQKNEKTGYIDRSGKIIIPFLYDSGGDFYDDGVALVSKNYKYILIDTLGNEIIGENNPYQNIKVNFPNDHLLWIKKDDKWAFFDLKGNPLTGFVFDEIFPVSTYQNPPNSWLYNLKWFYNDIIVVKQDHKFAVLNSNMDFIVPWNMYDWISPINVGGVMIVNKNNKFGLLNSQLEFIQPIEYDTISNLPNETYEKKFNLFWAKKDGKYFIFDSTGIKIDNVEYDSIKRIQFNFLIIFKNSENWILDINGKKINKDYKFLKNDKNGLIVEKNSKIGLINFSGNLIIPFEYEDITSDYFENIFVKKSGKWGAVSIEKNISLPCIYDFISNSSEGIHIISNNYIVVQNDKFGKVNSKGEEIFPCIYDGITTWDLYGIGGHYVMIGDKMGLIDYFGNTIIPIQYESISNCLGTNWVEVYQNGKKGLFNKKNGSIFLPIEYDSLFVEVKWPKDGPTRIVTFKKGNINILNEEGSILFKNLSINDLVTKFNLNINILNSFPCSKELLFWVHNKTYKVPECLQDELKRYNKPIESIFYHMEYIKNVLN